MSQFPLAGILGNPAVIVSVFQSSQEDWLATTKQLPGGKAVESLTIASGNVSPTAAEVKVDTESAAATDDLDHALLGTLHPGALLVIRAANTARTVVVRNAQGGSGQFLTADGANFSLDDTEKVIVFVLESTTWVEVRRSYGADATKARSDLGIGTIATLTQGATLAQSPAHVARVDDIVGRRTIFIPARATYDPSSGAAAALAIFDHASSDIFWEYISFDNTTAQSKLFATALPKEYNNGTLTFEVYWTTTTGSAGGVAWTLQAISVEDNSIPGGYGTVTTITDASTGQNRMNVSAESGTVTIGATPGDRELTIFKIARDPANGADDLASDARLIGVRLFFTVDELHG